MNALPAASFAASSMQAHRLDLLESGEQYFPAVFASIAQARKEVLIETFILFEDEVGMSLQRELLAAAKRGVQVVITVDGYGSPNLSDEFVHSLLSAGVKIHVYDPHRPLFGLRTHIFRRLHRKLTVIDGEIAYVGGINYSVDQLAERPSVGKLDFAVRIVGPVVGDIHRFMHRQIGIYDPRRRPSLRQAMSQGQLPAAGEVEFLVRDNHAHRDDIERAYRRAIHSARREIILCNAYFFPGYLLLLALRRAARRGVKVTLILQGTPDMPRVKLWEKLLYSPLLKAGVNIREYAPHPLHAKVAVIDGAWSTVGSSNLDPLSLTLNLEANVVIRNSEFCNQLRQRLQQIIERDCRAVSLDSHYRHNKLTILLQTAAYHMTRHFPRLAGWLPAHAPRLQPLHLHLQQSQRTINHEQAL